jgi:signal peptidase I
MNLITVLGISLISLILSWIIFFGFLKLFRVNNAKLGKAILIVFLDIIFLVLFWTIIWQFYGYTIILSLGQLILNILTIWFVLHKLYEIDFGKWVLVWLLQHIIIILLIVSLKSLIMSSFEMVGSSMNTTFMEWDYLLAEKIDNKKLFERWDLIVFKTPWKEALTMKRIIWLPGETVKIQENNVYICKNNACEKITEEYLGKDEKTEPRCGIEEFKINNGYFVMWDNRAFSTDSRCCFWLDCFEGTTYEVPYENVIWKIFIRLFPNFKIF